MDTANHLTATTTPPDPAPGAVPESLNLIASVNRINRFYRIKTHSGARKTKSRIFLSMLLLSTLLQAEETNAPQKPEDAQLGILKLFKLDHLSPDDQKKVLLLVEVTRSHQKTRQNNFLAKVLKSQRYEIRRAGVAEIDGERRLVVVGPYGNKDITTDIPFGLHALPFDEYWVKPGIIHGIDKLYDNDGDLHEFIIAHWETVY